MVVAAGSAADGEPVHRWRRRAAAAIFAAAALTASAAATDPVLGLFWGPTSNGANPFVAAPDWVAPVPTAAVLYKTSGGVASYIGQNRSYYVYANINADTGNPPSGTAVVTADASNFTPGQTTLALTAVGAPFTVCGATYGWRSASTVAGAAITAGAGQALSLAVADAAGNPAALTGTTVTVENTVPSVTNLSTVNGGTNTGIIEINDTLTYTYNDYVDPDSFSDCWVGTTAIDVTLRVTQGAGGIDDETVTIWDSTNTVQLPFGSIATDNNYVTTSRTFGGPGAAQRSRLVSDAGRTTYTVTLGTASGAVNAREGVGTMVLTPSAAAVDRAGNPMTTATYSETNNDRDF